MISILTCKFVYACLEMIVEPTKKGATPTSTRRWRSEPVGRAWSIRRQV